MAYNPRKKTYSENIKDLLEKYGNSKCQNNLLHVRRETPISLIHVSNPKIKPAYYKPELYYVRKKDRNLITFQVFDTQSKKEDRGDIFSAIFTTNIAFAYFIVKDNERLNDVNELIEIIESKLIKDFNANRKMFPICSGILIDEKELKKNSEDYLFKILEEVRKRDRW